MCSFLRYATNGWVPVLCLSKVYPVAFVLLFLPVCFRSLPGTVLATCSCSDLQRHQFSRRALSGWPVPCDLGCNSGPWGLPL